MFGAQERPLVAWQMRAISDSILQIVYGPCPHEPENWEIRHPRRARPIAPAGGGYPTDPAEKQRRERGSGRFTMPAMSQFLFAHGNRRVRASLSVLSADLHADAVGSDVKAGEVAFERVTPRSFR